MARRTRYLVTGAACLLGLLVVSEIAFRLLVGQRLLYRIDPEIEYLPLPNQSVRQGDVLFETNAMGMRSPAVAEQKSAEVFRVLVLGDSIAFGHTNISQPDLATTHLNGSKLKDGRRLEMLNVSAPSWGPGNQLAWIEANGLLGANAAILVLSSHDLDEDRTFLPPDEAVYPRESPPLALLDWIIRRFHASSETPAATDPRSQADARRSLPVLASRLASTPAGACLLVHDTTDERQSGMAPDAAATFAAIAASSGFALIQDRDHIDVATGYVDGIHLSPEGQKGLAAAMRACPALASLS